jgi:hypothetical protein
MDDRSSEPTHDLGPVYMRLREGLMERLGDVDTQTLISVISLRPGEAPRLPDRDVFEEWPDSFSRDHWYKTWAKSQALVGRPPEAGVDEIEIE